MAILRIWPHGLHHAWEVRHFSSLHHEDCGHLWGILDYVHVYLHLVLGDSRDFRADNRFLLHIVRHILHLLAVGQEHRASAFY
jgi:hypothetical protein